MKHTCSGFRWPMAQSSSSVGGGQNPLVLWPLTFFASTRRLPRRRADAAHVASSFSPWRPPRRRPCHPRSRCAASPWDGRALSRRERWDQGAASPIPGHQDVDGTGVVVQSSSKLQCFHDKGMHMNVSSFSASCVGDLG